MLVVGIKSRPVYHGLEIDQNASRHLFALEGEGAMALIDQTKSHGVDFLKTSEILYVPRGAENHAEELAALKPFDLWTAPTIPILLYRLKAMLQTAKMGTRFYVSGTEGFIGQAMQAAIDHGMDFNSIHAEHRGSLARRVQCVHCKGITDDVTTQPCTCSHCGLTLLVRDHYSRRIAAFQGVCIDAEEPGTAPAPKVLFP
jgi:dimethylamine monooxygenase subunit C